MSKTRRRRHTPEQIVKKLRDADAMLNAGKELAAVTQSLAVSEATYHRWRQQYGGMKLNRPRMRRSWWLQFWNWFVFIRVTVIG
jgi:transposase-like protein